MPDIQEASMPDLSRAALVPLLLMAMLSACTRDVYHVRAEAMKNHVEAFYQNLRSDRVASATLENEQIEALAVQIEDGMLKRTNQLAASEVDRDWMQAKAARETALENWLALAKYFTVKRQYDKARGTYQRILAGYQDRRYRTYTEQAKAGLRDLDLILSPPSKGSGS
jgi:hypothetical protein